MNIQTELKLVQQLACGERSDPIRIVQLLQNVPAAEINALLARLPPPAQRTLLSYLPAPQAFREAADTPRETESNREIASLRRDINSLVKQAKQAGLQITRESRSRGERVPAKPAGLDATILNRRGKSLEDRRAMATAAPTPTAQTQMAAEALATANLRRKHRRELDRAKRIATRPSDR